MVAILAGVAFVTAVVFLHGARARRLERAAVRRRLGV